MGVSFLILLVALVPLASSRDLRTATKVNRRTAPDPLLVQLFNDPTVTSLSKQTPDDSDDVSASGSGMWTMSGDEPKTSDGDKTTETETIQNAPSSSDTTTAVELATDQSTANVGSGSGAEPAAAPTKTQTMTEDETVETKDDSVTHEDTNGKKSSFIPAETQTVTDQVEEGDNDVRDSTAAPKGKAFDEKNMYDATIVKKDDVPKPNDVKATAKSVVVPSPDEQGGLAPLTDLSAPQNDQLQQPDQSQQLDQAQQVVQPPQMQQPQQDMAQMAMQPQQDMPQPAVQQPQPDMSQIAMQPQQDMAQASQQPAAAPQSISPDPSMQGQAQAYAGQFQDPSQQQTTANAYGQMMPQSTDQTMMQGQANAPVAPVNPYSDLSMVGQQVDPQTGMPIAGMQAVPVFQGLKAKKVNLKEDECEDMYDSCPEMAKNKYCVDYTELMKVQCKKSCGFCKVKDESSVSGSSAESSSSLLADSSASGSAMWNDDEDNELPIWRKSGIPSPGDKVVGESASGSAIASDVWSSSASGANMIKGESDTVSYSSNAEDTTAKKEPAAEVWESGSGQQSEDFGSASGANLAEDLATGTVSKTEQAKPEVTVPKAKYSEIPVPRVIIQQQPAAEIYPRIDLKVIAKAVNAYKSTALRMLGEAIRDAAQEAEDKAVKRTNIPMPPATQLLEKMGFPMEQPRSEVPPFPQPAANPYAQYYQQPVYGNNLQNFYTVQQNSVAKSEVETPKPKAQEPEPKKEDKSEEEESSVDDPDKKSDIRDPFQYVRHMKPGQSMQPIESRPGASLAPRSHSNPIILFKNSQLSNEAAKKNAIPKAPKITPKQMLQAAAPAARYGIAQPQYAPNFAQPKSDVSLNNILNQDANLDQPAQEDASQYEQQMPASDNQLDSTMDDSAFMRSEMTTDDQTNNKKKEGSMTLGQYAPENFREAVPSIPKPQEPHLPDEGPVASRTFSSNMTQKKDDLVNRITTGTTDTNEQTAPGLNVAASFFNNQPNDAASKPENKINVLPESNSYFADQPNAGTATAQIGGKEMGNSDDKSSFDAFTKQGSSADDEHQADSLFGSLASKLSIAPEPKQDKTMGMTSSPIMSKAEISGKIPKKSSMGRNNDLNNYNDDISDDFRDDDFGDGENAQSRGDLPPLNHGKEKADSLPPLNHGIEVDALPPLNHGTENAKALPPLNHGMDSGVLPPLNHGKEFAANLPPLNHGYKAESLPPLNHGMEAAANLPSLNHENKAESLPPLNHGIEAASNLPPLNHENKAESLPPLNHGIEAASNLPPLLRGVEQQNILPPLSNNDESVKSYRPPMLPPLEHAQNSPEMNFFYSNPTNTEGSRFKITADQMNNYQSTTSAGNANVLPPLNHNELPPLKYTSEDQYNNQANTRSNPPPIYPYSIPPEGATANQGYTTNNEYQSDDISNSNNVQRQWFPEGGNPYPEPLPPEGDQSDQEPRPSETKEGGIGKKNLIRPKPDLQCGSGWTGALGDFGTFCYKVIYEKSTWDAARDSCKSAGGDLFSVTNAYEQRFLENFTNIESWLGYRDKSLAGTWRWSDGSKSVYTDWDSSAKDDHGKGRDCVVLDAEEGKWRDASCTQKHSSLCKRNPDDCSKGWKKLTLNSVRGCYKFYDKLQTWSEAQQTCLDDDGTLASILSDDEQTMVSQVYSKHDMWIGYNDKDSEGDWVWTDRMTSSYTNWDDKSPNNGGVSCAIVTRTGKWHDEACQSKYSYICKKPSPKSRKDLENDGVLTQQVQDFISNNTLIPDIDTSVSIFGRSAVAPMYFWTAQKIYKNKIHGSNPIAAHGHIKSVDGGLQLNGVDSWLDAGDFYGQCLGDPDLCIKGFSFATQLNFDDDAGSYKDKRYVLDSSGDSRGVSIYIQNKTVHYKVVTSSKTWHLSTDLVTNDWQDVVLTWKKEEGLMLYVNGAFRDSQKDGTTTEAVPNKQARLTIGRKSGNPPYRYTRMYISSLYAFTRFLSPEDIPYVFTYDDTVSARYTWLLPELKDGKIEGSPEIEVHGPVKAVDGGVFVDGSKAFLKVGDFKDRCLGDPTKCPHGLSLSYKLKLNRIVRSYKERRYIMDSGGHVKGDKGIAAYIDNNNLYFTLAMSTAEDTLRWTVRTSIFTVRWQRVVLTWSLQKGLWLYIDGQFRGLTKTPKTVPRDVIDERSELIIGRKNIGDDYKPAEFSIGSLSIFKRFLDKKGVSAVFGEKKMPYPGLIREVWKELPGKDISKLKDDPYYPNDPSLVEIIENFDAPFDVDKDFGSRVKGYFVAPETGNYTFYLSGSKSAELWLSKGESQQNMSEMVALNDPTGHNQWNKFTAQISKTVSLEAGKYYYITALEKGTEATDSLSGGVRLPSGRFMRPISKETLQWRLPGDPFAGVIREVWQDIPGYKITDLTSNANFPNNPSSIEVLDKFDAPHNIADNYGARIRGYFKAPETGKYRFYLAADTTGELWLSTDEGESNVKKIVAINGWTDHNQWLKFPEQKSEHIRLKKGRYYYFEVYHKADKLADCASVAVEFPSGHFEGPIKRVHLSWRLPDGITGPGPSSEQEAIPKPAGLFPLTKNFGAKDASGNNDNGILSNVKLADGPDGKPDGAYEFSGKQDSYIEIPKSKQLDAKNSMTVLANIYPTGNGGPIINYKTDGWGVHLWQFESNELFVRFVHRNGVFHKPIGSRVIELNTWNQVGATYDNSTGVAKLWHNGKMVKSRNIGQIRLATQYPIRIGARDGDDRRFSGKIACVQFYNKAMDQQQIGNLKVCPVKTPAMEDDESGSGSGAWDAPSEIDHTGVAFSHEAGKYDKDEEADDLIQGAEFVTGSKKCDPNPCENEGKCLKDAKRLDGYRCKCSSDFTGRNCQVSKPDAENPVVKRTKIPRAEKKQGSEKYQKNSTSNGVIEQMREEKKEDVLLLFQKLGCYNDNPTRHDIPTKADIKSVSQEECVRACALKEQGFSYFGLQDSNQCYCGHSYGKYGRSDDSLCNKRCNGNNDENCGGNSTNMVYFFGLGTNYTVKVYTGDKDDADSDAKVYITLYGDKGDSGFRKLSASKFTKKEDVSETLLLPELGKLKKLRILHDNSGKHPSWFLKKVTVTDENGKVYSFPCMEWLSETRGGGKTERLLFVDNTRQS